MATMSKPDNELRPRIAELFNQLHLSTEYKPMDVTHRDTVPGFKWMKKKLQLRLYPGKNVIVNMELRNGMHRQLLIKGNADGFEYKGQRYIFDTSVMYYNIDLRLNCFDYHEDYVLPIKRVIPIKKIREMLIECDVTDVEMASNPSLISSFMTSKIAEGVMRGQQIDEFLRGSRIIWIVTMIASVAMLLLFMFKTGMFESVRIPGM